MSDILLHLLPHIVSSLLYAALGIHFWHTRWRETDQPLVTLPMQPWERAAIFGALVVQGFGLYEGLFSAGGMRFSFSFALSLMLWLAVMIYWLESFRSRMDGLQPMVLPLAALGAAAPAVFPHLRVVAHAGAWGFQLHFLTAMLAYSLFTLSALHAVFMGFAERKLHQRAVTRSLGSLPPILTIGSAAVSHDLHCFLPADRRAGQWRHVFRGDLRQGRGVRSQDLVRFCLVGNLRRPAGWTPRLRVGGAALPCAGPLAGFMVLLLAYMGSRFVAEVLLGRL
jgi:ABC-type uncharacterized transport system permease subunit